jgi:hypothetical protein
MSSLGALVELQSGDPASDRGRAGGKRVSGTRATIWWWRRPPMVAGATTAAIAGGRARRLAWRRRYRARGRGPGARGGPPAHPGALGGDGEAREGRTATPRSTEAVAGRGEDGGVGDERESPASIPSTRMLREARRSFGPSQLGAG